MHSLKVAISLSADWTEPFWSILYPTCTTREVAQISTISKIIVRETLSRSQNIFEVDMSTEDENDFAQKIIDAVKKACPQRIAFVRALFDNLFGDDQWHDSVLDFWYGLCASVGKPSSAANGHSSLSDNDLLKIQMMFASDTLETISTAMRKAEAVANSKWDVWLVSITDEIPSFVSTILSLRLSQSHAIAFFKELRHTDQILYDKLALFCSETTRQWLPDLPANYVLPPAALRLKY